MVKLGKILGGADEAADVAETAASKASKSGKAAKGTVEIIVDGVKVTAKRGKGFTGAQKRAGKVKINRLSASGKQFFKKTKKGPSKPKNPVLEISREKYPNHTKMLENAQKKGHSLEGLERGSGTRAAQKNRYEAQKEIRKKQGPPPKGHDYDEFPYASTKQGGAGSHVESVPSAENQAVGRDLGNFYREQGIKENGKLDIKITD